MEHCLCIFGGYTHRLAIPLRGKRELFTSRGMLSLSSSPNIGAILGGITARYRGKLQAMTKGKDLRDVILEWMKAWGEIIKTS